MADNSDIEVDHVIEQLLAVRGARPGRQVNLTENEIRWLCIKSREIFVQQPILLELEAPIKICGIFQLHNYLCASGLRFSNLQATFTDSTTIFFGYLNMEAFLLQRIIYFLGNTGFVSF